MKKFLISVILFLGALNAHADEPLVVVPGDPTFNGCVAAINNGFIKARNVAHIPYVVRTETTKRENLPTTWVIFYESLTQEAMDNQLYGSEHCTESFSEPEDPGSKSSVTNSSNNPSQNKCPGSVIDYRDKTVSEQIPLDGSELYLNYSSAYKQLQTKLILDDSVVPSVEYDTRTITLSGDNTLYDIAVNPSAHVQYDWNGTSLNTSNNIFVSKLNYILKYIQHIDLPLANPGTPEYEDPDYHMTIQRTNAQNNKLLVAYHPEVWGLGGWTFNNHHYFDRETRTLYRGDGIIESYSSDMAVKSTTIDGGDEAFEVPNKNDSNELFVFNSMGMHVETRSAITKKAIYKFHYDNDYRLSSIENGFGKITQILYDSSRRLSAIIAPYGQRTNFNTIGGQITDVFNSLSKRIEISYTDFSGIESFKALNGVTTTFTYSPYGELISESKDNGLLQALSESVSNLGHSFKIAVNWGISNISRISGSSGFETTVRQNAAGETIQTELFSKGTESSKEFKVSYEANSYNTLYNPHPMFGMDLAEPSVFTTTLSESGTDITESETILRNYQYQFADSPESLSNININHTYPGGETDSLQVAVTSNYALYRSPLNRYTYFYFNADGNITRIAPDTQSPIDFTYDTDGRLTKKQKGSSFESYSYDEHGFLQSIGNSNNQTTSFTRDLQGKVLTKTLPNQEQIKFEYTDAGEIKKITTPSNQVHNFQMSLGDYITQYLDPNSGSTVYDYDSDKRLTKVTKPGGGYISYNYHPQTGNLQSAETAAGNYQFLNVDPQGRPHELISPDNIDLQLAWVGDNLKYQIWLDSDGSTIGSVGYNYESNTQRVKQISVNGTVVANMTYQNGAIRSINSAVYSRGATPSSDYTQIQTGAVSLTYSTDDNGNGNSPTQQITAFGDEDATTWLEITLKRVYDNFGQASVYSSLAFNAYQGVLSSYYELTPQYDTNNRLVQIQKVRQNRVNGQITSTTDFYNHYSFPLGSNNNIKEFSQTADATGLPQKRTIATHSADDKLLTLRGSIHRDYTYAEDGSLKSMTNCYGTTNYEYDIIGSLKKVTLPDGKVIEYKVDAQGRRVKKSVNGSVQEYYLWYDQIHLAAILDSSKSPKLIYLYGPESNSPSYLIKDGITYRIVHDPGLGSVRYVINSTSKQIVQDIEYDEYGNVMKNTNPEFQPLTFAGGLYDTDTKFIRFGARDYDPTIGRWTTKDPIGFGGGDTNLYGYVGANPMSALDPLGKSQKDIDNAIAFVKGFIPEIENVNFGTFDGENAIPGGSSGRHYINYFSPNVINLDKKYLKDCLSDDELSDLLDTVYHESLHERAGLIGANLDAIGDLINEFFPKIHSYHHEKITRDAIIFTGNHFDEFKNKYYGR